MVTMIFYLHVLFILQRRSTDLVEDYELNSKKAVKLL